MNAAARKRYASKQGKSGKGFLVFLILIALIVAGVGAVLSSLDLNAYRPQIADAATKALNREVILHGPMKLEWSFASGFSLVAEDVTLANPSWASRPVMAKIGRVFVHVDPFKLLAKKLDIVAFDLKNADILLETRADGANNWTFKTAGEDKQPVKEQAGGASAPVSIEVREVSILASRFGMLGKDGKLTILDVPQLVFKENGKGITAHFDGAYAGTPVRLELTGGKLAAISGASWPFVLQATYGAIEVSAKGSLLDGMKKLTLGNLAVKSGQSSLEGAITVAMGGARTAISGNLKGNRLDPADFSLAGEEQAAPANAQPAKGKTRIFSREPLPLDGLKAVDVDLMLTINELMAGVVPVRAVILPVKLQNGRLDIASFSGMFGGNKGEGRLSLDASSPAARLSAQFEAKDAEMAQLLSLWGAEAVITGKTDVDFNVTASGRSMHDMASSSNGSLNLLMDAGQVSATGLKNIAAGLLDLFAPGAGGLAKPGINCLAGRYVITNGLVQTKGLLIDTDVTTISGMGAINLPDEHISMTLMTRPKALGLGAVFPPMKVYGDLAGPNFTLDGGAVAQKVVGLLTNSSTSATTGVPTILKVPAGQNACAATLDNPAAAKAAENAQSEKKSLLPLTGSLQNKIKGVGDKLLRGIGGGLLGQ